MSSTDKKVKVLSSQRGVEKKNESTNESLGTLLTTVVRLFEQLFGGIRIRLILCRKNERKRFGLLLRI